MCGVGHSGPPGENARLMWWKDGRISGVFAYKGHVYTIVNVGGECMRLSSQILARCRAGSIDLRLRGEDAEAARLLAPGAKEEETASKAPKPFTDAERQALEAKSVTIDLMILYMKKAAGRYINDPPLSRPMSPSETAALTMSRHLVPFT